MTSVSSMVAKKEVCIFIWIFPNKYDGPEGSAAGLALFFFYMLSPGMSDLSMISFTLLPQHPLVPACCFYWPWHAEVSTGMSVRCQILDVWKSPSTFPQYNRSPCYSVSAYDKTNTAAYWICWYPVCDTMSSPVEVHLGVLFDGIYILSGSPWSLFTRVLFFNLEIFQKIVVLQLFEILLCPHT